MINIEGWIRCANDGPNIQIPVWKVVNHEANMFTEIHLLVSVGKIEKYRLRLVSSIASSNSITTEAEFKMRGRLIWVYCVSP